MSTSTRHVPVMRDRVIALLAPALEQPGAVLVDATLGLGGHAEHALSAFPDVRLVGLDRDPEALRLSGQRLAPFRERVTLIHAVYDELPAVLEDLGLRAVQGVLFDLGVSSMQLDESTRGFAYSQDAPLDMRMDPTTGPTAADVLNTYPAADLARILRQYGEERFASRIAARVVSERQAQPFTTSARLVDLIRASVPAAARRTGGNPAKRTFQALRIEVNGELDSLRRALPSALDCLALRGRIVVMSYQSLEDRIVKRALAVGAHPDVPPGLPIVPDSMLPWLRLLTRGAETASADEVAANPRAASVRVRAAERVAVAA
jgi:16S rRNA (cytosine1402-N4)-methyltransferase